MNEKNLKNMSAEEANNKLSDEEFEEWQKLKRKKLREGAKQNIDEWNQRNKEALDAFKKGTKDELTKEVEVYGQTLEILLELSDEQISLLKDVDELSTNELEDLSINKADEIAEKIITLLSSICVTDDVNRSFWVTFYEDTSVLRLYKMAENILMKWKKHQEKNKSFRSNKARTRTTRDL